MKVITEILSTLDIIELKRVIAMIFIIFVALTIAMLVDLHTGVQKAKLAADEARRKAESEGTPYDTTQDVTTSEGFRRTVKKAKEYFEPIFITACIDIMTCWFSPFPVLSCGWGVYCGWCEFKSVIENNKEQDRLREAIRFMKSAASKDITKITESLADELA